METPVPPEILKVQRFGRLARRCCLFMAALFVIAMILVGVAASKNIRVNLVAYSVPFDQLSTAGFCYAVLSIALILAIPVKGLWHLYALFTNLAEARIYTAANVRHIRQLGLLAMAWAVLNIILPMGSLALLQLGLVNEAAVTKQPGLIFGTTNIPSFITASLLILASWIMEVGRRTTDEAEQMRREAELVV